MDIDTKLKSKVHKRTKKVRYQIENLEQSYKKSKKDKVYSLSSS